MLHRFARPALAGFAAAAVFGAAATATAVPIPASYDFGNAAGKDDLSDFTVDADGSQNDTYFFSTDAVRTERNGTSLDTDSFTAEFDGLSDLANFEIELVTTATQEWGLDFNRVGILALGDTAGDAGYFAGFQNNGSGTPTFAVIRDTINSTLLASVELGTRAAVEDTELTLTLNGTRVGTTDWLLSFTIAGLTTPVNVTYDSTTGAGTNVAGPNVVEYNGDFAGVGHRLRGAGGAASDRAIVQFDTFSVVPEPASLALLAAGCGLMVTRRRK